MATEKRLIDANDIYDAVLQRYKVSSGIEHICERDFLFLIVEAPTVDAVEVVRCKECKHWEEAYGTDGKLGYCACLSNQHGGLTIWYPDDYCSYGERKDNESNCNHS